LTASQGSVWSVETILVDTERLIWKKSYAWTASEGTGGHTWKLTESRKFVYDGWNLVAEFVADAQGVDHLARAYAWGQETVGGGIGALLSITAFAADGTVATYLPLMDGGGNVTGLVDANTGDVVATYRYDPFGNLIEKTGDAAALAANPFGFSTKYFDQETGLYYYGYRYYSPELGKWMTRDPLQEAGGVNVYGFVGNDPVNKADMRGLSPVTVEDSLKMNSPTNQDAALWIGLNRGIDQVMPSSNSYLFSGFRASQGIIPAAWMLARTNLIPVMLSSPSFRRASPSLKLASPGLMRCWPHRTARPSVRPRRSPRGRPRLIRRSRGAKPAMIMAPSPAGRFPP